MFRYIFTLGIIIAIMGLSASFITIMEDDPGFKNLKILPKNITEEQLDSVMESFKASLGVKCSFCHAMDPDTSKGRHFDFASDAKPAKEKAREMLQMTAYLNATYFNPHQSTRPDTLNTIICFTCHRGTKEPVASSLFPQLDSIMVEQHRKH